MIMKEHTVLQDHTMKEKICGKTEYLFFMFAFLTKLRSSKTKLHLTHFTSYLSQPYSPITYTYNRLSIDLSNQEINSTEHTAF